MALLMIEGFDHLTAAQGTLKGWSTNFGSVVTGRFGGQAAVCNTAARDHAFIAASTVICGFAFQSPTVFNFNNFFSFKTGVSGTAVCALSLDASGHIVLKNSGGTTIATSTTALVVNTWHYIELKVFVNGASGTCELHINGVVDVASTTGNFGSTNIGAISLNPGAAGINVDFDDIYVLDTSGSAPRNTFLGDVRVATLMPTGAGNHTAWTPNGAASNWDCVDETTPDGDTTYVSDATPGDIDTYITADVDAAATVYAVQETVYARKDDANVRQIAPVTRQAGTDYIGTTVTLSSSYLFYSQLYNQDPTAADWTAANVNSDEFGVKEIA